MRTTHLQFTIPLGFMDIPLLQTVWMGMKFVDPISATAALLSPLCFQFLLEIVRNSYKLTVFQKAKSSNNNSVYYNKHYLYAGTLSSASLTIIGHFRPHQMKTTHPSPTPCDRP